MLKQPLKKLLADNPPFLLDAHAGIAADRRETYLRPPNRSTVDYILLSPEFQKRLIPGSAKILSYEIADPGVLEGSDHSPIFASFKIGE